MPTGLVTLNLREVLTVSPDSLYKLYKQRLRWYYGYIKNLIDYKHLLLRPKFGILSLLVLPSGIISIRCMPESGDETML